MTKTPLIFVGALLLLCGCLAAPRHDEWQSADFGPRPTEVRPHLDKWRMAAFRPSVGTLVRKVGELKPSSWLDLENQVKRWGWSVAVDIYAYNASCYSGTYTLFFEHGKLLHVEHHGTTRKDYLVGDTL